MAAKKPALPTGAVTSSDVAELTRLRARLHEAERILRRTSDPWEALRVLGLVAQKTTEWQESVGRRGRSARERSRLADLYANMRSAPGPCRPAYARTPERLDLLLANAADCIDAQREGRPVPPLPAEAVFVPDCDVPMSAEDALRNVQRYLGRARATAWKLLRQESKHRKKNGQPPLDLPPR